VEVVLQVNGKIRDKAMAAATASEEELKALALANAKVQEAMGGKAIRKAIVVPKRLVNLVV
jgi:leucyl-tRNA synthetase